MEPREVAAVGHPDPEVIHAAVHESWIAAASDHLMSVYATVQGATTTIGAASFDLATSAWSTPVQIPLGTFDSMGDPGVAADPTTGNSVACGYGTVGSAFYVATASYDRENDLWGPWTARSPAFAGFGVDKPWIIAGAPEAVYGREYYLTYSATASGPGDQIGYRYLRSRDGGVTWNGGVIQPNGVEITGIPFAFQTTHGPDSNLYAAYMAAPGTVRFVKGVDIDLDPLGQGTPIGLVQFEEIMTRVDGNLVPLEIQLNYTQGTMKDVVPGPGSLMSLRRVPWIASHPTNWRWLYLVVHDTAAPSGSAGDDDVDVYLYRIKYKTAQSAWFVEGDRILLNTNLDPELKHSDQFMPSLITGLENGEPRIHVIYYDDRRMTTETSDQLDGNATPEPKFDVFYTKAEIDASGNVVVAAELELFYGSLSDPARPYALDFSHFGGPGGFRMDRPGDFNGIVLDDSGNVHTTFAGTEENDLGNESVIWWSRILP